MIFTREEAGKPNQWDFIAAAWECIPSKPEIPVTKRAEFCHSSWNAEPLLEFLTEDEKSYGLYPNFVRLQVDADADYYTVNLYTINYRTWDVRCLWQGDRLSAFGVMDNSVFCRDSRDWFCLDTTSGRITKDLPFIPLTADEPFWLVRKLGEKSGSWSYDPVKKQFVGHFGDVDESRMGHSESLLSSDGKNRAWLLFPTPGDWRGGQINGTLVVQRDGQAQDILVPVTMYAGVGSGVSIIPIGIKLSFPKYGIVEFSSVQQPNAETERVWTIAMASGKLTESTRKHIESKEDDFAVFGGVPTPDYLRPYLKNFRQFGRDGMAPAFLMYLGILEKAPEYPDCTAAVSPDGEHILYKANSGPLADAFIYGNLKTKQTVRWAAPVGIEHGDAMEFVWVETP